MWRWRSPTTRTVGRPVDKNLRDVLVAYRKAIQILLIGAFLLMSVVVMDHFEIELFDNFVAGIKSLVGEG